MTFLIIGDANADLLGTLARYPAEGDDSPLTALRWGSGGAGVNVATALALLGDEARLLARVGRDPAAAVALRAAHAAGVDMGAVQHDDALATGLCFAAVSPGGERTFFSFRGANVALDAPDSTAMLNGVRWLHICGHALLEGQQRATTLALLDAASQHDVSVSLDLCLPLLRAWHAETVALLPRLSILFANEPEAALLCPAHTVEQAAVWLAARVAVVAVKRGAQGCLVAAADRQQAVAAFSVAAVDTTGCGDAFVAGFLHAHARGAAPIKAAVLANALGALTATRHGSADALPPRAEVDALVAQHYRS